MSDVFLYLPQTFTSSPLQSRSPRSLTLLYFIPGNPGLIEYYTSFLTLLSKQSEKWSSKGRDFGIAGVSLGGFETLQSPSPSPSTSTSSPAVHSPTETKSNVKGIRSAADEDLLPLYPPSFPRKQTGTYTLRDQIELSYARLTTLVNRLQRLKLNSDSDTNAINAKPLTPKINIILAGHSVGAYIALELVNLHHHNHHTTSSSSSSPSYSYTITQTHLLTPTILHISHSPSGRIATPLLSYLPFIPLLLQLSSKTLTSALPTTWVRNLVRRVTGMKNEHMVDVTTRFLGRAGAVRQALELAKCEMSEIAAGDWSAAVWGGLAAETMTEMEMGSENAEGGSVVGDGTVQNDCDNEERETRWTAPVHHFLFAREDHWVANETRATIIRSMTGRAKIVVDEGELGLVHAWCLEQSEMVAGIVGGWIEEMFGARE